MNQPQLSGMKFRSVGHVHAKSTNNPKQLLTRQTLSNRSFLISDKQAFKSSKQFFQTPLLNDEQLNQIDRMKKASGNDFYRQLHSSDPYQFQLNAINSVDAVNKFSQVKVSMPVVDVEYNVSLPSKFTENLNLRRSRDRLHRSIPQKHDIHSLASWIDRMLDEVQQKQSNDLIDQVLNIFTLCLKELIRQISLDCLEKSVLLEKVWMQYVDINRQIIEQTIDQKHQQEKQDLQNLSKTHKTYQLQIDNYDIMLKKERKDLALLTERFLKLKDVSKYLKRANRNIQKDQKELKFEFNDLTRQNKLLQLEIQRLRDQLEDQNEQQKFQVHEFQDILDEQKQQAEEQLKIVEEQVQKHKASILQTSMIIQNQQRQIEQVLNPASRSQLQLAQIENILSLVSQESHMIVKYARPSAADHLTEEETQRIIEIDAENRKQRALEDDSRSENLSNLEDILADKETSTADLYAVMLLLRDGTTQTIEQQLKRSDSVYLKPDTRQQIIQTECTMFNVKIKETQTELLQEEFDNVIQEEEEMLQIRNQINDQRDKIITLHLDTPAKDQIKNFMSNIQIVTNKLEMNIEKQRKIRSSLIIENQNFMNDNIKKDVQLSNMSKRNSQLIREIQAINQEVEDLESQLEKTENNTQKFKNKYNKAKIHKLNILDKTQKLAQALTKTLQFRDILKNRLNANREKKEKPQTYNIQITTFDQTQQDDDQSQQAKSQNSINSQESFRSSRSRVQEVKSALQTQKSIESIKSRKSGNSVQQFNINVKKPAIKSSRGVDSPRIDSNRVDQSRLDSSRIDSGRNLDSQRNKSKPTERANKPSNFQLIPNNSTVQNKRQKQIAQQQQQQQQQQKVSSSTKSQVDIMYIKETLQNILNQNVDTESSSSSDTSFEDDKSKIDKRAQRKSKVTIARAPNFNHRQTDSSTHTNPNQLRSEQILKQIVDKVQKGITIVAKMQRINVLKLITQFYSEKNRQYQLKQTPLHVVCYEYYFNTYSYKAMMEKKLINFLESVIYYRENARINLFARFMSLTNPLSSNDLELYLKGIKELEENADLYNPIISNENGMYANADRAIISLEKNHIALSSETKTKIIKEMKTKVIEIKKTQYIDVDSYLEQIIDGYLQIKVMHFDHFEEIFYSADMDLDGMIEYEEFQKLYYHLEVKQGNTKSINEIQRSFMQSCDTQSDDSAQKAMTFDRFITFSIENNLFTKEKLDQFSGKVSEFDPIKNYIDLQRNWIKIRSNFHRRLEMTANDYYQNIILKLDKALNKSDKKQSLWISYRIIDEETKAIYLDRIIATLLPDEFVRINELVIEMIDDQ